MNYDIRSITVRFCFFILMLFHYACSDCKTADHCHSYSLTTSLITPKEERDLEFDPAPNKSHQGVLSVFDKTYTESGKKRLMDTLKNPTADVSHIQHRQKQLKLLLENPQLLEEAKALLSRVKTAEQDLLYFTNNQEDQVASSAIDSFLFQHASLKKFNKNSVALDARRYGKLFSLGMPLGYHGFGYFLSRLAQAQQSSDGMPDLVPQPAAHAHNHGSHHHHHHSTQDLCGCPGHTIPQVTPTSTYATILNGAITIYKLLSLVHVVAHVVGVKEIVQQMDSEVAVLNQLYKRVSAVKGGLRAISQLNNRMQESGYTAQVLSASDAATSVQSTDVFASLVDDHYFNGNSLLRRHSPIGKTLYNYQLLKEQSGALNECMTSIADIDALVSIAEWYKEQDLQDVPVCFVDFVTGSEKPVIKLKDAWHVGLNPTTATVSDIEITADKEANKFIITGPHKGGKTLILRQFGVNLALAHAYGITAARKAEMTPLHKLVTYIDVSDDMKKDVSSFSSEKLRAEECLHILQSLPKEKFACLLVDDSLLKRTDAANSLNKSRQFLMKVAQCANACALVVVHERALTELEQQQPTVFKNYRIKTETDADGKTKSLFTLEPGVVAQGALMDIIESEQPKSCLDE